MYACLLYTSRGCVFRDKKRPIWLYAVCVCDEIGRMMGGKAKQIGRARGAIYCRFCFSPAQAHGPGAASQQPLALFALRPNPDRSIFQAKVDRSRWTRTSAVPAAPDLLTPNLMYGAIHRAYEQSVRRIDPSGQLPTDDADNGPGRDDRQEPRLARNVRSHSRRWGACAAQFEGADGAHLEPHPPTAIWLGAHQPGVAGWGWGLLFQPTRGPNKSVAALAPVFQTSPSAHAPEGDQYLGS